MSQPERLHHRQHPLCEPAAPLAMAAEGVLPPQHTAAQDSLGAIIRRLDPLDPREQPSAGYNASRFSQNVAALVSAQPQPRSSAARNSAATGSRIAWSASRSIFRWRKSHQAANSLADASWPARPIAFASPPRSMHLRKSRSR